MASNALALPQNQNIVAQRAGLQLQGTAIARPMPVMNGPGSMQAPGMQNPVMQRPMPVMQPQPQMQATGAPGTPPAANALQNPLQATGAPGTPPAANALQNPLAQNFMRSRMMGFTQ